MKNSTLTLIVLFVCAFVCFLFGEWFIAEKVKKPKKEEDKRDCVRVCE